MTHYEKAVYRLIREASELSEQLDERAVAKAEAIAYCLDTINKALKADLDADRESILEKINA